jgi:hypothetical protein
VRKDARIGWRVNAWINAWINARISAPRSMMSAKRASKLVEQRGPHFLV